MNKTELTTLSEKQLDEFFQAALSEFEQNTLEQDKVVKEMERRGFEVRDGAKVSEAARAFVTDMKQAISDKRKG